MCVFSSLSHGFVKKTCIIIVYDVEYPDNCYLLFGKETKGLPEELLMQHPDDTLRLPMIDEARSLNLSNSVAIAAYEVLRQWDYPALQNKGELHNHKWSDLNNMT